MPISLHFDLCFQNFDTEIDTLKTRVCGAERNHADHPGGHPVADGMGMRLLGDCVCEMKRMYVRPGYCGIKLGEKLTGAIVEKARAGGYRAMRAGHDR